MTDDTTLNGELTVDIGSSSHHLGGNVPVEVRDSDMRLVSRSSGRSQIELPAGLYEVSAVLEDGETHRKVVRVAEGKHADVVLTTRPTVSVPVVPSFAPSVGFPSTPYQFSYAMADLDEYEKSEPDIDGAELVELKGAELLRSTATLWILEAEKGVKSVPTAVVRTDTRLTTVSLPTSYGGSPTPNTCAVRLESTSLGPRVTAWITSERTVANALQNMLRTGEVLTAADIAMSATKLLAAKYSDPTGAALGALILNKTGRLSDYESWLGNLARHFDWMPDAKVLLAGLILQQDEDPNRRGEALGLIRKASAQRMLFTESYSNLLTLIRRWPADDPLGRPLSIDETNDLLDQGRTVDWGSTYFTQVIQEDV